MGHWQPRCNSEEGHTRVVLVSGPRLITVPLPCILAKCVVRDRQQRHRANRVFNAIEEHTNGPVLSAAQTPINHLSREAIRSKIRRHIERWQWAILLPAQSLLVGSPALIQRFDNCTTLDLADMMELLIQQFTTSSRPSAYGISSTDPRQRRCIGVCNKVVWNTKRVRDPDGSLYECQRCGSIADPIYTHLGTTSQELDVNAIVAKSGRVLIDYDNDTGVGSVMDQPARAVHMRGSEVG